MTQNKTILIIEDEAFHRKALASALTDRNFKAIGAENAEEGLAAIQAETPMLIVLDLLLPKMHGLVFLENLRANPATASIPVMILTAFEGTDLREKTEELGVQGYFVKSEWRLGDLVEKITEIANTILGPHTE